MTHDYAALTTQLEQLNAKATAGQWRPDPAPYEEYIWGPEEQMVAEMRGDGEGLPQEANRDLILALRNNLPTLLAALEAAQQVERLRWQAAGYDQLRAEFVAASAKVEKLTKALDWIRGYIDSHSHKHFVEFTNDNPELKAWRAEVDRLLAKEALSAIEEES